MWPRRNPGKPSPGRAWKATDRGTWLRSSAWVPVRETFFFSIHPCCFHSTPHALLRFFSPIHVAPHARVHATTCDDQRSWWSPHFPLGLPNRPSGCPFCFTLPLCARPLDFCGHIIPATGWRSALFCQRLCRHGLMIATSWVTISFNHKVGHRVYVIPACVS